MQKDAYKRAVAETQQRAQDAYKQACEAEARAWQKLEEEKHTLALAEKHLEEMRLRVEMAEAEHWGRQCEVRNLIEFWNLPEPGAM
jgi:hypothetical protein